MIINKSSLSNNSVYSDFLGMEVNEFEQAACYSIPYKAKNEQAWHSTCDKLISFWKTNNVCPFPVPASNKLVVIGATGKPVKWHKPWINFLLSIGVDIYYAVETVTWHKGVKKVSIRSASRKYKSFLDVFGKSSDAFKNIPLLEYKAKDWEEHDSMAPQPVYLHSMVEFVANHVATWMNKLSPEQLTELLLIFHPHGEVIEDSVVYSKQNGGFSVDFKTSTLAVGTATHKATASALIASAKVEGKVSLWLIASQMANKDFKGYMIRGLINDIPSAWEEDPNYGIKSDTLDPSRVVTDEGLNDLTVIPLTTRTFPFFHIEKGDKGLNVEDALKVYEEEGVIVADKNFSKTFTGKKGANAVLIGVCGDWIYTLHDASKISKFLNRPMQARKHLKAEQYTDATFSTSCREKAKLGSLLPDGEVVHQWGRKMVTAMTTGGLAMGSGACLLDPNEHFYIGVNKTLTGRVSLNDVPTELVGNFVKLAKMTGQTTNLAFNGLMIYVQSLINNIDKNKFFQFDDEILAIDYGKIHKCLVKHRFYNQIMKFVGGRVIKPIINNIDYSPTYFNIELIVENVAETQEVKLRNDALKATTVPDNFKFYDMEGNEKNLSLNGQSVQMVFNNEVIKGRLSQITAYTQAQEHESVYDANTGMLNDTIDLKEASNEVSDWAEETAEWLWLEQSVAKTEWECLIEAGNVNDVVVVKDWGNYVVVRQKVQCLLAEMLVEVEISTAHESVGMSGLTPEMLAGIATQCKKLSDRLALESKEAQKAILDLVNMTTMTKPATPKNSVDLSYSGDLAKLKEDIGSLIGLSDEQVLRKYKRLYPYGVYLSAKNVKEATLYLDFNTIRSTMVWVSGSADSISQDIVGFLRKIVNPTKSGVDSEMYSSVCNLLGSLRGWLKQAFKSKSILKRAAKTVKVLVNGKIRTCYYSFLNTDSDGIPKIALNPDCHMTMLLAKDNGGKFHKKYTNVISAGAINPDDEEGKISLPEGFELPMYCKEVHRFIKDEKVLVIYFNPFLLQSELVAAFRVPMFMGLGAKLVITEKVGKSHAYLLPNYWSRANEGDTDGDGVGLLNCGIRGLNAEDILAMNSSINGMKGYSFVYGKKVSSWPYAEFSEQPKKKWFFWDTQEEKEKYLKPYVTMIPRHSYYDEDGKEVLGYFESCVLVKKHYQAAVGIAYGIASVLTFQLCEEIYKGNENTLNCYLLRVAVVIAWRSLYEGLGLAGFTPEAKKWFAILNASSINGKYVFKDGEYMRTGDKRVTKTDPILDGNLALLFLGKSEDETKREGLSHVWMDEANPAVMKHSMLMVMSLIRNANNIRAFMGAIERGSNMVKIIRPDQFKDVAIYGSLRRMGQGTDPAGLDMLIAEMPVEHDAFEEVVIDDIDNIKPTSLFRMLEQMQYHEQLSCPWMKDVLTDGIEIHTNIANFFFEDYLEELASQADMYD